MKKNKIELARVLYYIVLVSLIMSLGYIVVRIADAPLVSDGEFVRTKSSYVLMFTQCILGIVALHLPDIFAKHFSRRIPSNMIVLYIIFLYCAIYLGEVRDFYYRVEHWDMILHTFSGAMLGALGFSVITLLNKTEKIPLNLSPFFVCLFAFCFAVTLGVVWEIYEFTFDAVLHLNMQKFMTENGVMLVGRAALADTMEDLIVDAIGAFLMSFMGYLSLKYKTSFIERFHFVKVGKKEKKRELS